MKDTIVFRPICLPFIIGMIMANIFIVGLVSLFIVGIFMSNWLFIVVGVLGFTFGMFENIKLLSWKVILYDKYIYIPSGVFDWFLFKKNTQQIINYVNINRITLKTRPFQVLMIECNGKDKPNLIYVKQFTKRQVERMMAEINLKITQSETNNGVKATDKNTDYGVINARHTRKQ